MQVIRNWPRTSSRVYAENPYPDAWPVSTSRCSPTRWRGDPSLSTGGYIDLETGMPYDDEMMDLVDRDELGIGEEDDLDPRPLDPVRLHRIP